ncbi:nibrin-like isoform X2 [Bolinopsis microptera]
MEIKLGHHPTVWTLELMKVVVSNLQGTAKREVVGTVKRLQLAFSGEWDKTCTTLIMSKISTTVKVIKAVSHCRTILTPAFIKDLDTAIKDKIKIPMLNKYIPSVSDLTLRTAKFHPIAERKTLFDPLQFVFMSVDDKKESEQIVKDLGGTVALLDPLFKDRRKVILSEESIVMETKDAALSKLMRTTLLERGLVPTKHGDLILSLFYNDKTKLFKKFSETQSTQSGQIRIQDTQGFSQMSCTLQETQTLDVSSIEASAVPPRLDKTILTPLRGLQSNSTKVESCASTMKPEMCSEPDEGSKTTKSLKLPDLTVQKPKQDISFYEASVFPPKLDRTIKTPLASPFSTKQEVTFIEPSAVPPRLDATIKSPLNSIMSTGKSSNISAIEPSHIVSPLERNSTQFKTSSSPSPLISHATSRTTSDRFDLTTPTRTSVGSDVSLFDNSRSKSFVEISTPSGTLASKPLPKNSSKVASSSRKRNLMDSDESDEDSEDENNPFAASKTKSSFFSNTNNRSKALNSSVPASNNFAKKPKLEPHDGSEDNSTCRRSDLEAKSSSNTENTDADSTGRVCESPPSSSPTDNYSIEMQETSSSASQPFKRELKEKTESVTKRLKTGESPVLTTASSINVTIPDTSHSIWLKRPDTNTEMEKSCDSFRKIRIDVSSDLIKATSNTSAVDSSHVNSRGDQSVVNYKMFKKKGVVMRSMNVTVADGQFRSNTTSIFEASQSQQSVGEEEEEISIFSDRNAGSRRTVF